MRVVCFIFIVQAVLLLTQPCDEIFPNLSDNVPTIVQISLDDDGSTTETQGDECSPFCICSCCGHPVANPTLSLGMTAEAANAPIPTAPVEYSDPDLAAFHNSIWQPPRA